MRILLIQPANNNGKSVYSRKLSSRLNIYPPLTIQQLAGITPDHHEVDVILERYQKIDLDWDGDLIAISFLTPEAVRAYELAEEFRSRGKKVILGGWHASALPWEAKKYSDSVVIGEAEQTWLKLLNDFEKGFLKSFYKNKKPVDIKDIPFADRRVGAGVSFLAGIQASRGCPMGCEFCGVTNSEHGKIFRKRSIDKVIEEINTIKQKNLYFYDPSMTVNPAFSKELFNAMKPLNKSFVCFGNMDVLGKDEELLKISREAGCKTWYIGLESFSQETINELKKRSNRVKDYEKVVSKIHNYDMSVVGSLIFGFDTDTKYVFKNTIDMLHKIDVDVPEFTILTPYPGTPLFDRLEKEGRILTKDWSKYTETGNVVFKPKNMSPEELFDGTEYVINEIYSTKSIMKRAFKTKKFIFRNILSGMLQHSKHSS